MLYKKHDARQLLLRLLTFTKLVAGIQRDEHSRLETRKAMSWAQDNTPYYKVAEAVQAVEAFLISKEDENKEFERILCSFVSFAQGRMPPDDNRYFHGAPHIESFESSLKLLVRAGFFGRGAEWHPDWHVWHVMENKDNYVKSGKDLLLSICHLGARYYNAKFQIKPDPCLLPDWTPPVELRAHLGRYLTPNGALVHDSWCYGVVQEDAERFEYVGSER